VTRSTRFAAAILVAFGIMFSFKARAGNLTQLIVQEPPAPGGPRVALGVEPKTGQRFVQLAGLPAYPTIDVMCDGKRRTLALTRPEEQAYEVSAEIVTVMLDAIECRLFIPDHDITLARRQLWTAWASAARGADAPPVLLGQVVDVIDGNTIRVALGGRAETVRYIGIDTRQTDQTPKSPEPGGRDAADANRELVARQQVRLELDVLERDRNGHLLAYVYVGPQMVNAELVRRGQAEVLTVPPNMRHRDVLVTLEQEARDQKRGLWADPSDPTTPTSLADAGRLGPAERPGVGPESAWACPALQPVKGSSTVYSGGRCIYHVPEGELYGATRPDRCYKSVDDARLDGCQPSRR
jgi:micrococcal nuclease